MHFAGPGLLQVYRLKVIKPEGFFEFLCRNLYSRQFFYVRFP
jgi:hypothetical protein